MRKFGAKGDGSADDSHAFQRAIDFAMNGSTTHSALYVPSGIYLVGDLIAPAGLAIEGESDASVLRQTAVAKYILSVNPGTYGSADAALQSRDISLRHLHFSGWVDQRSFSEHVHLLNINACTKLNVERCRFSGFCGDGIYIGSSNKAGTERHNKEISIRQCTFDGVSGDNRNAISVIDCDDLVIESCIFINCSRQDMPGAIDIEPDEQKFHRIRNITIRNNRFSYCTGGIAAISVYLPIHDYDQPPQNIRIEGNLIDGNFTTNGISLRAAGDVRESDSLLDILVVNNVVVNTLAPLIIGGIRGVVVAKNTFETSQQPATIAHPSHGKCADITLKNNQFVRLGQRALQGVRVFASRRVSIIDNVFRDCGPVNDGSGTALDVSAASPVMPEIRQNHFQGSDKARRTALALPIGVTLDGVSKIKSDNLYSANILPTR